jgi:hypothetical protein
VFSEDRIPSSIARQSALDAHKNDFNNPHKVNLQQAGAVTDHDLLINAKGYLGHSAIEAHIKGLANRPATPMNDHACPSEWFNRGIRVRLGALSKIGTNGGLSKPPGSRRLPFAQRMANA